MATKTKSVKQRKSPLRFIAAPFVGIGNYLKGSWYEIRQVRWPDRKATWSMTLAVIVFSGFFAGLIVLLDYIFHWLFKEILL
ncbi:MAG TPA: preprotein translocase subunit SecE [Candidatus Saccharimonadales bacterium]|nr:preprotein translocase subunit SecE [Candidatus Saccharimonadales bacterium]